MTLNLGVRVHKVSFVKHEDVGLRAEAVDVSLICERGEYHFQGRHEGLLCFGKICIFNILKILV